MEQYQFKVKYPYQEEKTGQIKNALIIGICKAVSYTDAETTCNEVIESQGLSNYSITGITRPKACEIIGSERPTEREDIDKWWFKVRVVYITESDKGKININYHYYLVYTKSATLAIEEAEKSESGKALIGDVDQVVRTEITHMVYE